MGIEDYCHILRDCKFAKEVWNHVIDSQRYHSFFTGTLMEWIKQNTRSMGKGSGSDWPSLFLAILWHIWARRNKVLLGHDDTPWSWVIHASL